MGILTQFSKAVLFITAVGCFWAQASLAQEAKSAPIENTPQQLDEEKLKLFDRFVQALDLIQKNYFDDSKVSDEQLIDGAIQGMLKSLDPHSEYLPKEQFLQNSAPVDNFSPEIGVSFQLADKYLEILSVQDLSPASASQIRPKDVVLKINGIQAEKLGVHEAIKLLQGPSGSSVNLTIISMPDKKIREVSLKREPTPLETSISNFLISPKLSEKFKIAYVRISLFDQGSGQLFIKRLMELDKQGAQGLILDLRNNPGGYVAESLKVCDAFLPPGAKIVSIEGRLQVHTPPPFITPEKPQHKIWEYPVVVLMDHASASAAELVAGALKDSKRAVVIGTKSFGKGSVQTILPIPSGGALKLTTGRYFTPDHRTIHGVGIEPNIVVVNPAEIESKVSNWWGIKQTDPAETQAQLGDLPLIRAVDLIKGLLYMENSGASSR